MRDAQTPIALVTGFEPFGGETTNPSWEAAASLPDELSLPANSGRERPSGQCVDRVRLVRLRLPVSFARAPDLVVQAVRDLRPAMVLCLGQAAGRTAVTPEFVGINFADAAIPDNDGAQPRHRPLVQGAPDAHFASLPVHRIVQAQEVAGLPAQVSYSAGTYVCNATLYRLLDHLVTEGPAGTLGGFMHLPLSLDQAAQRDEGTFGMALEDMTRAVTIALEVSLADALGA